MSGHRRVKNIDYDDDDDYDYDEEYSPEDREQMRIAKDKVREALGSQYSFSDREIEDNLWDTYYDVEKVVAYLKNKRPPKPKQLQTQAPASKAAQTGGAKKKGPVIQYPFSVDFSMHEPISEDIDFFADIPWHGIPEHRRGIITDLPHPRGGLLGGSSKLAALAKKKKEEAAKAASSAENKAESGQSEKAVTLLDRLNLKSSTGKENERLRADANTQTRAQSANLPVPRGFPLRKKPSEPIPISATPPSEPVTKEEPEAKPIIKAPVATASPFASILVGMSEKNHQRSSPESGGQEDSSLRPIHLPDYVLPDKNPFADPSPDDVVLNAQAKGSKTGKASKPVGKAASNDKATNGITEGVAALSTEEAPRVKSKNLDVKQEYEKSQRKNAASFVVIGHVDHGKSTLMGRLLYDLKVIDQRSVDKLRKEAENKGKSSFALAWVMDQTSEERDRGITVDIATNYFETEHTRFTILDAPGHQDFIPNMIAGASQADFAVLVIDSSINSFEAGLKGQTKEHVLLVKSMGVQRLVIAVNKMDTVSWSQERFQEIEQQMSAFFKSVGFQPKNVVFVPCAGLTGENIVRLPAEGVAPWYKGRTLVQELESEETSKRSLDTPLRMSISDIFRGGVTTPLSISGRLDAGSLQIGDQVIIMPSGEKATIKGVEIENEARDWAVAGQIATLHLTEIDAANLRPGDILCSAANPIKNARSFVTQILAFEHVMPMFVDVHRGRLHTPARITKLLSVTDKKTGQAVKKKPRVIQPGSVAKIVVELDTAIPLEARDKVVLRSEGHTVAAGLLESAT